MSRYPVIYAGQRLTASTLSSMLPLEVFKAADTNRASTTTYADDPDLTLPLEANATYWVEMFIHYSATTTPQIKTNWSIPSGATGLRHVWGVSSTVNGGNPEGIGRWGVHGFTTDCVYGTRNSTNQAMAWEAGHVITTNAGSVALSWAQNVSDANATRVAVGSFMRAKRIL